MNSDMNIKPSIITSFYEIGKQLKSLGFKERDILILLQDRTKPKIGLTDLKNMYDAIKKFEKDFIEFIEKRM